jgi:hypothetical protein
MPSRTVILVGLEDACSALATRLCGRDGGVEAAIASGQRPRAFEFLNHTLR